MASPTTEQVKWYFKVALLGVSIALLIGLLEGAGRTMGALPPKADAEHQAVSRAVGRLPPPYDSFDYVGEIHDQVEYDIPITLNKLGFRTEDPPKTPPADATRIVLLGDSFTSDWQVSEDAMWSAWLGRELHASGVLTDVVNLGYPGWGTAQEFLLYQEYGRTLHPDLVVLVIYAENDVADNGIGLWEELAPFRANRTYFTLDDASQLVKHPWPYVDVTRPYLQQPFPANVIGWLDKNSVIYRALRNAVDTWQ